MDSSAQDNHQDSTPHGFFNNLLFSGMHNISDRVMLRQVYYINTFSFIAYISVVFFGLVHFFVGGRQQLGFIEITGGAFFLFNLLALRIHKNVQLAKIIMHILHALLLVVMLQTGGIANTGIYWYFTYPLVAFYISGRKIGRYWVIFLFFATILLGILASFHVIVLQYSSTEIQQLLIVLLVISVVVSIYQKKLDETEAQSKQSEDGLQELNKKLQVKEFQLAEAQQIGAVGSYIVNMRDNAVIFSEEMYKLHGRLPQQEKVNIDALLNLVYPDDRQTVQQKFIDAMQSPEPFELIYRTVYPDKSIHWLKTHARTMMTDTKTPLQIIGTVSDVTDLKQQEASLRAKTDELTTKVAELEQARTSMMKLVKELNSERAKDGAILSSIGDGVIATDEAGKIIFINPKVESLLGWRLLDVIGKPYEHIVTIIDDKGTPYQQDAFPVYKTLASGQFISATNVSYVKKDKTNLPVATSVAPILMNGKTIGAIDIFRDITRERDIDRMKTEFISLASHQLRTPLSAINWLLEILLAGDVGPLTKEQLEIVSNINQSNVRMISLVNSLLNVSRIESGRIIVDPEPTDLRELMKEVESDIRKKIDEKKHIYTCTVADNVPKVSVDPKLLRQVYMNLLTNAIKYTPEGGNVSVNVFLNNDMVVSEVMDTGFGIPEKDAGKVFSKFYRGENIVKVETDGNGLGLYLVKAIIESSNGTITYRSVEGKGTTFSFSLPLSGMMPKSGEVVLA
jgi:PAS domain S-box-containing protein